MTFRELCEREPRLAELEQEVRAIRDDPAEPAFCANAAWYGYGKWNGIKPRLVELVGWEASRRTEPALTTETAYNVAYRTLYNLLPDCRNCCC